MTAQSGNRVILKIGNGGTPEVFSTVGGVRTSNFTFSTRAVDVTTIDSNGWRELLDTAGQRSISLSGRGLFTDQASEHALHEAIFANQIRNYQLHFGNGDILQGKFKITRYSRSGNYDESEDFTVTMESSGPVAYLD